ncbi:hypothetical protein N0V90_000385 [Kalmusia sp. IMI 367209]|nr:hypothetical protein N0V90_000385 [Kalmusia sp. IMI 367209]
MLSRLSLAALALTSSAQAACPRSALQDATAALVKAQTAGTPSTLPLSPNATYIENDASVPLAKGVLSQPVKIDLDRSLHDTTQCATFTELIAATNGHPYVIMTRLLFAPDASAITSVQSVIADAGDWLFNATGSLTWSKKETWDAIPEAKRDTRDVIKAAGDAYLDSWGDGKVKVPYGTPCARLEGGAYTGDRQPTTNTCKMPEFPKPFSAGNRRYVIDEEVGGVDIFNDFPFIDKAKPNGTASTNFIRVEGGMIRYIHEVTICTQKNCGR